MAKRVAAKAGRVRVLPGQARRVVADVRYASPDGRALVVAIDSCTKYPGVSFHADNGVLTVLLWADEDTLRHDRRYKRPTTVELPLPRVSGDWRFGETRSRYGTEIVAVCVPT